jgi:hypothetical protein
MGVVAAGRTRASPAPRSTGTTRLAEAASAIASCSLLSPSARAALRSVFSRPSKRRSGEQWILPGDRSRSGSRRGPGSISGFRSTNPVRAAKETRWSETACAMEPATAEAAQDFPAIPMRCMEPTARWRTIVRRIRRLRSAMGLSCRWRHSPMAAVCLRLRSVPSATPASANVPSMRMGATGTVTTTGRRISSATG